MGGETFLEWIQSGSSERQVDSAIFRRYFDGDDLPIDAAREKNLTDIYFAIKWFKSLIMSLCNIRLGWSLSLLDQFNRFLLLVVLFVAPPDKPCYLLSLLKNQKNDSRQNKSNYDDILYFNLFETILNSCDETFWCWLADNWRIWTVERFIDRNNLFVEIKYNFFIYHPSHSQNNRIC